MSALRIGVVGVGALGQHHARVVRDAAGVSSSGVFDIDEKRSEEIADGLGVPRRRTLDELLEHSDAVVVAVPTSAHEETALAALDAGCHVFIEKPLAPDLQAADRIVEAAQASSLALQVGHVERFNSGMVAARPYIDGPLFVESHRLAPFSPRSLDVAVVLDLMIHDVDLVDSLVGAPVSSIAATGIPVLSANIDIANARIEFESGAVANLTASRISVQKMRKIRVWQPSGYLSLDLATGVGEFYRLKEGLSALDDSLLAESAAGAMGLAGLVERIPIKGDGTEPLAAEIASFRDAALGVAHPPVSGQDGRRALELSLAIEQQIKEHVAHTRSTSA